jgi:hypothetical protein
MLPSDIIMNFVPPASNGFSTAVVAGLTAIAVALIAAGSLWLSDVRKKNQEDRRRWDEQLVDVVIKMLVITDDVATTQKQLSKKKKAILAGDLPSELNQHLIHIRLLSNEQLADKAQDVATHFLTERMAMNEYLTKEVESGRKLADISEVPGYSLGSTAGDAYNDSRRYFLNLFHQLLVSAQVRKFTAQNSVNWKNLMKQVEDFEKEVKKKEAEPKHLAPKEPEPATAVRDKIL